MHGRSAGARAAAAGGAVVALVLLASLAGRHPAWSTGVGRRSFVGGASGYVLAVLVLAVAVALVVAWVRLARQRRERLTRSDLRNALALLLVLLLALLLARGLHHHNQSGGAPGRPLPATRPHSGGGGSHAVHWSDARWLLVLPLLALLGLAVASFVLARRRRVPAPQADEPVAEAVVAVLDEALDDLGDERDPRRAVIVAYARMEDVLAEHGLGRRPAETPYEYLARVLTDLRASERSARRLTELFEWAKFSTHEVSERMRADAIGCLTSLRAEVAR